MGRSQEMGQKLSLNWKFFSLEQVNNKEGSQWKIWEQPDNYPSRGLRAFWAAEAARCQGVTAFNSFHVALLRARHEKRKDIADIRTIIEVAENANLIVNQFQEDLGNRQLLTKLAEDHTFAIDTLGIFGTPTLVFPEGQAIFLKMASIPPQSESLAVFNEVCHLAERRPYLQEIKRPQRPGR